MSGETIIGLLSFGGTVVGSLGGILAANRLTNYRISQLEEKVNRHNNVIERTYKLQQDVAVLENRQKVCEHRLEDLEKRGEI